MTELTESRAKDVPGELSQSPELGLVALVGSYWSEDESKGSVRRTKGRA